MDLIAELEAATEGSRELDNAIEALMPFPKPTNPDEIVGYPPFYTTSLDAALTLIPEGWNLAGLYDAVEPIDRPWVGAMLRRDEPYKMLKVLGAKTYALAMCVAALRARQAMKENE